MEKRIPIIGLVFLLLFSSVIPISIGDNVNNKDTSIVNKLDMQGGVSWIKKLGSKFYADEGFSSICETSDGGYIIIGMTSAFDPEHWHDAWLVKTDKYGNVEWQNNFGEPGFDNRDYPSSIEQTPDGGYIFSGQTLSYTDTLTQEIWLVKTDNKGNELWNKRYGPGSCNSFHNTVDGGFILTGNLFGPIFLLKTDKNGNELWRHKFWGYQYDGGESLCVDETYDGGYIATGYKWYNERHVGFLLKTDSNGVEEWNKTYGKSNGSYFKSVQQTPDEGFIIGGDLGPNLAYNTAWLVKTDKYGNELWNMTYYSSIQPRLFCVNEVDLTKDGGYILAGESSGYMNGLGYSYIIKTDSLGNKEWQIDLEPSELGSKQLNSIKQTSDGGYIAVGAFGLYDDGLLIRLDIFENTPPNPPTVIGPMKELTDLPLRYTAVSSDPDGDGLSYFFDWDEEFEPGQHKTLYTGWNEPFGKIVSRYHTYQEDGIYHIKVKAMDEHYAQSDWTTYEVSMPRTRALYDFNWLSFLERFPILQNILNHMN